MKAYNNTLLYSHAIHSVMLLSIQSLFHCWSFCFLPWWIEVIDQRTKRDERTGDGGCLYWQNQVPSTIIIGVSYMWPSTHTLLFVILTAQAFCLFFILDRFVFSYGLNKTASIAIPLKRRDFVSHSQPFRLSSLDCHSSLGRFYWWHWSSTKMDSRK